MVSFESDKKFGLFIFKRAQLQVATFYDERKKTLISKLEMLFLCDYFVSNTMSGGGTRMQLKFLNTLTATVLSKRLK